MNDTALAAGASGASAVSFVDRVIDRDPLGSRSGKSPQAVCKTRRQWHRGCASTTAPGIAAKTLLQQERRAAADRESRQRPQCKCRADAGETSLDISLYVDRIIDISANAKRLPGLTMTLPWI